MNIEGMRHAEVVAFIKKGGEETWLLVVDPDTDEHFKKKGIVPTVGHVRGRPTLPEGRVFIWTCELVVRLSGDRGGGYMQVFLNQVSEMHVLCFHRLRWSINI